MTCWLTSYTYSMLCSTLNCVGHMMKPMLYTSNHGRILALTACTPNDVFLTRVESWSTLCGHIITEFSCKKYQNMQCHTWSVCVGEGGYKGGGIIHWLLISFLTYELSDWRTILRSTSKLARFSVRTLLCRQPRKSIVAVDWSVEPIMQIFLHYCTF